MNYATKAMSKEVMSQIINTIRNGYINQDGKKVQPNNKVVEALLMEYNLGIRVSDNVQLKLSDITERDGRYYIDMTEQKTGKERHFNVNAGIYQHLKEYCNSNNIPVTRKIVDVTTRQVQRVLKSACDYLGIEDISTHSFRKTAATDLYIKSGYDIELVREFLQHSSVEITQRYLNSSSAKLVKALDDHCLIV